MAEEARDTTPFISVVIPVRDDLERLRLCLEALAHQTYPRSRYEIIVVDNGSTRPLRDELADGEIIVAEEWQEGSYAARNRGIELASGDLLAFTDADCIPTDQWLEKGVSRWIEAGGGLVAGDVQLISRDRRSRSSVEIYEAAFAFPQERYVADHNFGVTANLFVGRSVFEEVGDFNSSLKSGGDYEFGQRATAAGFRPVFSSEAVVSHPARRTWKELITKTARVEQGSLQLGRVSRSGLWKMVVPPRATVMEVWKSPKLSTVERIRVSAVVTVISWVRAGVRLRSV